ncbi:Uma2 family endonuclease [Streptomyces echinatus]|uniref:Uma2 family endonuclease n=1 Tax=Streptomyces echinatus TaxID=67293 RepID=UPI0037B09B78
MTVMAERVSSQMSVDMFERIAEFAAREDETVGFEFIDGRIGVKKVTNGNHDEITMWLVFRCKHARPELTLYPDRGLKVGVYRNGRARPDGVLAPAGHFTGKGNWADPQGVLMTVEITSHDSDTHSRDRVEKPRAYAEAGIPVYLLIDRENLSILVHSNPDLEVGYRDVHVARLGGTITLPDPVGIELDTEDLKPYAD